MSTDQPERTTSSSAATERCGMCDGTGSIVVHFRHGLQEQDCPACGGTGRITAREDDDDADTPSSSAARPA